MHIICSLANFVQLCSWVKHSHNIHTHTYTWIYIHTNSHKFKDWREKCLQLKLWLVPLRRKRILSRNGYTCLLKAVGRMKNAWNTLQYALTNYTVLRSWMSELESCLLFVVLLVLLVLGRRILKSGQERGERASHSPWKNLPVMNSHLVTQSS